MAFSASTTRNNAITLIDHSNFTPWIRQLESFVQSLHRWDFIDPDQFEEPEPAPIKSTQPLISKYTLASSHDSNKPIVNPSQLSAAGIKAYKEDYCQILGWIARIRNGKVHNDEDAHKMMMELMIN